MLGRGAVAQGVLWGEMPRFGCVTCSGEDCAAERPVGPAGCTPVTLPSSPSQKCLTASPRTCGGASSPAAMTVSAHQCPRHVPSHPSLGAGRAAGHPKTPP